MIIIKLLLFDIMIGYCTDGMQLNVPSKAKNASTSQTKRESAFFTLNIPEIYNPREKDRTLGH